MVYEKDGEMERVLEKQAELIGQFEAEENAQREWRRNSARTGIQLRYTLFLFRYETFFI